MTNIPTVNPYAFVLRQVKAMLTLEMTLSLDDKPKSSWQILHSCHDLEILAGKGGTNTCFWSIGKASGKRRMGYPSDLIEVLQKHARQSHIYYLVKTREGSRRILSLNGITKSSPTEKTIIEGMTTTGQLEKVASARINAAGKLAWLFERRGKT